MLGGLSRPSHLLLWVVLIPGPGVEPAQAQSCPTDRIWLEQLPFTGSDSTHYELPTVDTVFVVCVPPGVPPNCFPSFYGRITYNWPSGSFRVEAASQRTHSIAQNVLGNTRLDAADRFELSGVTEEVTIRARLAGRIDVRGDEAHAAACATLLAVLTSSTGGVARQAESSCATQLGFDLVLETAIRVVPGSPFDLGIGLHALTTVPGSGIASTAGTAAAGTLTFLDVPPGASIRSCKGFTQGVSRATSRTWGQLKAMYR